MVPVAACRALFLAGALLMAVAARAAEKLEPPKISPPNSWVPKPGATIRVLDKVGNRIHTLTLANGQTVTDKSLSITLKSCYVRPPDLPADATAHVVIADSTPGAPGFSGWLLQNEPGVSMLEHPVYNVTLVGCGS